jgi:hypothetical protein
MNGAMHRLRAIIPFTRRSDSGERYVGPRRLPSKSAVLERAVEEIVALRAGKARAESETRAVTVDRDRWKKRAEALWEIEGHCAQLPPDLDEEDAGV